MEEPGRQGGTRTTVVMSRRNANSSSAEYYSCVRCYRIHNLCIDFVRPLAKVNPMKLVLDFPEETFSSLRRSPTEFAAEMRLAAAVKWFELGRLSQAKAAEVAGLSRAAFIAALAGFGVSPVQLRPGELETELHQ